MGVVVRTKIGGGGNSKVVTLIVVLLLLLPIKTSGSTLTILNLKNQITILANNKKLSMITIINPINTTLHLFEGPFATKESGAKLDMSVMTIVVEKL